MAVNEQARRRLYDYLEAQMGDDLAETLMGSLPPGGWAEMATKQDLDHLHVLMRSDLMGLAHELRGEMAQLEGRLRFEIAELRGETRQEFEKVRTELHRELRSNAFTIITANAAISGFFLAALKLL